MKSKPLRLTVDTWKFKISVINGLSVPMTDKEAANIWRDVLEFDIKLPIKQARRLRDYLISDLKTRERRRKGRGAGRASMTF